MLVVPKFFQLFPSSNSTSTPPRPLDLKHQLKKLLLTFFVLYIDTLT